MEQIKQSILAVACCALTDRREAEGVEVARIAIDLDRRLGLIDYLAVPLIVLGQIHSAAASALAFASFEEALGLAERAAEPQSLFPATTVSQRCISMPVRGAGRKLFGEVPGALRSRRREPDALMILPFLC